VVVVIGGIGSVRGALFGALLVGITDTLLRGRAVHAAVFEPEKFAAQFVVWEDRRAGKAWEKFAAEHRSFGREVITQGIYETALAIAKAVRADATAAKYLSRGRAEVALRWSLVVPPIGESIAGWTAVCRGRVDFIAEHGGGCLVDLKSVADASPRAFGYAAEDYGWHAQAAYYRDGYEAVTGRRLPFALVAVEAKAPHVTQVYRLTEEDLEAGREKYLELHNLLQVCRTTNHWPGYAEAELDLELPDRGDEGESTDITGVIHTEAA
jgi:hypothetical protein